MKKQLTIIILVLIIFIFGIFYFQKTEKVLISDGEEKIIVEEYVDSNINMFAQEETVLGGSWYLTEISVDTEGDRGEVTYEDGHIQGKVIFDYEIKEGVVTVTKIKPTLI